MSPQSIRQTAGAMGRLGAAVAVVGEGIRVNSEVQEGKPVDQAIAGGVGRLSTNLAGAGVGAGIGGQIGSVAPPYGPVVGSVVGGLAGAAGVDMTGVSENVGRFSESVPAYVQSRTPADWARFQQTLPPE
jgi:hypothetical protein